MTAIRMGIVGGGYMGKAHSVAMRAVGAVFNTALRPELEMICASTEANAAQYRSAYGFRRSTGDWEELVRDPDVEAIIIASPQSTHRMIAEAAFELEKPVFCEKPLGDSLEACRAMVEAAERSGAPDMVGYNYIRTPATQFARQLISSGAIGEVTWFRGEHTEDFFSDPQATATWRTRDLAGGAMGDLAPHMVNAALTLVGRIQELSAEIEAVHDTRPGPNGPEPVVNDDQGHFMCRFANGAMGHLYFSRVATGRKMGYAYEVTGTKGAVRFDQEDQNALWIYECAIPEELRGFRKVLTGPAHPDYGNFCEGAGHGTGYQDQIIIEARDFLKAIETRTPVWPTFRDGLAVQQVIDAAWKSHRTRQWVAVEDDSNDRA